MPTYQYECDACGHAFETIQSMLDKKLKKCPECGKLSLVRLVGAGSGIIFKGSGFYETDYKRKAPQKEASCPLAKECASSDKTPPCASDPTTAAKTGSGA